jgi:hypothetical protein
MALFRRAAFSLIAAALFATPALAQAPQPIPIPHRGDMVPQAVMQAGPIANYQAMHLRKPPTGYGWYHIGRSYVMASESNGLIVEVVVL